MPNTLLTASEITREALRVLHNKLTFVGNVNRQYDDSFAKKEAKVGDTIRIRLPNEYVVGTGRTVTFQDTTEVKTDLRIDTQKNVAMGFFSDELALSLNAFSERIIDPAMARLAGVIEADVIARAVKATANTVGAAGSIPTTLRTYLQGRGKMNSYLAPLDANRSLMLNSDAQVEIVDALKGLFHDSEGIKKQYREGIMGRAAGFDWYEAQTLPTTVNGNKTAAVTISGAGQTGAALLLGGLAAADTFKEGQVFTIAGVFQVNQETKQVTSTLQQFVVRADAVSAGATLSVTISPGIAATGASQNVSASPANAAAVTFIGAANATINNLLAWHKDAYTFATVDLPLPKGTDMAAREQYDGISMRLIRDFDTTNDRWLTRVDVMYGFAPLYPQHASRIIY